jgi:hypothetical protein
MRGLRQKWWTIILVMTYTLFHSVAIHQALPRDRAINEKTIILKVQLWSVSHANYCQPLLPTMARGR